MSSPSSPLQNSPSDIFHQFRICITRTPDNSLLKEAALKSPALAPFASETKARNSDGDTFLHLVAGTRQAGLAYFLVVRGSDLASVNKLGETSLHRCCLSQDEVVCRVIVEEIRRQRKFEVLTLPNRVGENALMLAVPNVALVRVLRNENPDLKEEWVKEPDIRGCNVLHHAATRGSYDSIVDLVFSYPTLLDKANSKGETPRGLINKKFPKLLKENGLDELAIQNPMDSKSGSSGSSTDKSSNDDDDPSSESDEHETQKANLIDQQKEPKEQTNETPLEIADGGASFRTVETVGEENLLVDILQEELEACKTKNRDAEKEISGLKGQLEKLREESRASEITLSAFRMSSEKHRSQAESVKVDFIKEQRKGEEKQEEIARLEGTIAQQEEELGRLGTVEALLKEEQETIKKFKASADRGIIEIEELRRKVETTTRELEENKRAVLAEKAAREKAQRENGGILESQSAQQETAERLQGQLDEKNREIESATQTRLTLRQQLTEAQQEQERKLETIKDLRRELEECQKGLRTEKAAFGRLLREKGELSQVVETARKTQFASEAALAQLRQELEAAQSDLAIEKGNFGRTQQMLDEEKEKSQKLSRELEEKERHRSTQLTQQSEAAKRDKVKDETIDRLQDDYNKIEEALRRSAAEKAGLQKAKELLQNEFALYRTKREKIAKTQKSQNPNQAAFAQVRQDPMINEFVNDCRKGSVKDVRWYIEKKVNLTITDAEGKSLAHHAASQCQVEVLRLLLEFGARVDTVDKKGNRPIDTVPSGAEEEKKIKELLENPVLHSGLYRALSGKLKGKKTDDDLLKFMDTIKILDTNFREPETGYTLLHLAVLVQSSLLTGRILDIDPSIVDAENSGGDTALMLACGLKDSSQKNGIVQRLMENGADPHKRNPKRPEPNTPFAIGVTDGTKALSRRTSTSSKSQGEESTSIPEKSEIEKLLTLPCYRPVSQEQVVNGIISDADFELSAVYLCSQGLPNVPRFYETYRRIYHVFSPYERYKLPEAKDKWAEDDAYAEGVLKDDKQISNQATPWVKQCVLTFFQEVRKRIERLERGDFKILDSNLKKAKEQFPAAVNKAIFQSIEDGQLERIRYWVEGQVYPELDLTNLSIKSDDDTVNPLHFAALKGRYLILSWFLKTYPYFEESLTEKNKTIRALAISKGDPLALFILDYRLAQRSGSEGNETSKVGNTSKEFYGLLDSGNNNALHLALRTGCLEELPFIMDNLSKEAWTAKNKRGMTPLEVLEESLKDVQNRDGSELKKLQLECKKIFESRLKDGGITSTRSSSSSSSGRSKSGNHLKSSSKSSKDSPDSSKKSNSSAGTSSSSSSSAPPLPPTPRDASSSSDMSFKDFLKSKFTPDPTGAAAPPLLKPLGMAPLPPQSNGAGNESSSVEDSQKMSDGVALLPPLVGSLAEAPLSEDSQKQRGAANLPPPLVGVVTETTLTGDGQRPRGTVVLPPTLIGGFAGGPLSGNFSLPFSSVVLPPPLTEAGTETSTSGDVQKPRRPLPVPRSATALPPPPSDTQ